MDYINMLVAIVLGALLWTLTEYILHRFFGHVKNRFLIKSRFYKEHTKHHLKRHYFASAGDKLLTLIVTAPLLFFLSNFTTDLLISTLFTTSFTTMYLVYEWVHLRMHIKAPPHLYASKMRAHHFYHHFEDENMNHGVTTPIWDYVFGTYRKPTVITYPEKFRLRWLTPNESGVFQDRWGQKYFQTFLRDANGVLDK